jgi:hypothetical protein
VRSINSIALLLLLQVPAAALADAVGLPRRALTEAEVVELSANMDCSSAAQRGNNLTRAKALEIARQAVSVSETWSVDSAILTATRDECGWDVHVALPNPGPGDYRRLRINAKGRVLVYVRGL